MKISIRQDENGGDNSRLTVVFQNDGEVEAGVSLDRFLLNAERVALDIRDSNGQRLDPLGYKIVTSIQQPTLRMLGPGEALKIELPFMLEPKSDTVSALIFKHATYRLERNAEYTVKLAWDGIVSNEIRLAS